MQQTQQLGRKALAADFCSRAQINKTARSDEPIKLIKEADESMRKLVQPDTLKTDREVPFSGGAGNDVWRMLTACVEGNAEAVPELLRSNPTLLDGEELAR
ncbi:hypothetical protein P4H39_14965 [Paenibacillus lautus]|uniref:hypothetical protein n=2 Tax=Paenibacillus lautus TaxID=1401 RepID=UPI002DB7529D|nr:hypothetical protein [Paenibacillus lautus]MEC0203943.1 hypothetical protein [Paenibacillus lautus]